MFLIPDEEERKWVLHIKDVQVSDRVSCWLPRVVVVVLFCYDVTTYCSAIPIKVEKEGNKEERREKGRKERRKLDS